MTNANALVKGNTFTRDNITYRVTFMDKAHDGLPERYEVEVASSTKTGAVTIPNKVYDLDNQYNFTVSGIGNACTMPSTTSVVLPSTIKRIGANVFAKRILPVSRFRREQMISATALLPRCRS